MGHRFFQYVLAVRNRLNQRRLRACRGKLRDHIAMFHDIKADGEQQTTEYDCYLSDLEDYIRVCRDQGICFVALDEMAAESQKTAMAVLTFDDGFESVYTLALPLLKANRVPFTVYVTTAYLGTPGYLTQQQLQQLAAEPLCTIGMHANEHKMFRYESAAFLKADYDRCKTLLQALTGKTPSHYAFPYGSVYAVSAKNVRCVKNSGAASIALTDQRMLTQRDVCKPYQLPRLDIPGYYNGRIKKENRGLEVGKDD